MTLITPYQTISAYTLGRFLGLALIARDPQLWGMSDEQIVESLKNIAAEYEVEQKAMAGQ